MSHQAGRYVISARVLHWITAAIVLSLIAAGLKMVYAEPPVEADKLRLYNIHESLGVVVFALALWRLIVRWRNPPPALPEDIPSVFHLAAHATHGLLYVLLLAMPVIGFLGTNAWGFPLEWFGILPIPSPLGPDETLAPILSALHWWGAFAIILLILAHVAGALFHHLIRRDPVLRRML